MIFCNYVYRQCRTKKPNAITIAKLNAPRPNWGKFSLNLINTQTCFYNRELTVQTLYVINAQKSIVWLHLSDDHKNLEQQPLNHLSALIPIVMKIVMPLCIICNNILVFAQTAEWVLRRGHNFCLLLLLQ